MTKSIEERFWEKVDKSAGPDGCWLWTASCHPSGYGQFSYAEAMTPAHRVAWVLTNGPIPKDSWVLHHCDVRKCVNPAHLFLGTAADNSRDAVSKGRRPTGEAHRRSKLTKEEVLAIREEAAHGTMTQLELGQVYGVSPNHVSDIVRRKSWRHLP